jgi:hypothetical protein
VARDAVAKAIVAAQESAIGRPLLDHLHLIRLALLDGKSVLADYMPPVSIAGESAHAS